MKTTILAVASFLVLGASASPVAEPERYGSKFKQATRSQIVDRKSGNYRRQGTPSSTAQSCGPAVGTTTYATIAGYAWNPSTPDDVVSRTSATSAANCDQKCNTQSGCVYTSYNPSQGCFLFIPSPGSNAEAVGNGWTLTRQGTCQQAVASGDFPASATCCEQLA